MIDPSAEAATREAIGVAGVAITYSRNVGVSPAVTSVVAALTAVVRLMQPDTTSPAQAGLSSSKIGVINQDQRLIILMAQDLIDGGIALPVKKDDTIAIVSTGEVLAIDRADPYKRAFAGAIEIMASAPA